MDPLTNLYVEITTACNLDYRMCRRRAWDEPAGSMPLETFRALMAQLRHFSPPPIVHRSGYGEPMFHRDFTCGGCLWAQGVQPMPVSGA